MNKVVKRIGEIEVRLKVSLILIIVLVGTHLIADPFEVPKPSAGMVVRPNMTGLLGQIMQNNYNALMRLFPGDLVMKAISVYMPIVLPTLIRVFD